MEKRETEQLGLLTDLYELTMAAGYLAAGRAADLASFELYIRRLPPNRSFLVAAGLEQAVEYLLGFGFSGADVDYLRGLPVFESAKPAFFEYLRGLRFSGDLHAVPEGTVVFAEEPLLRVTAPLAEAQIVETYLTSTIAYQTMVATKAARVVEAAAGRTVVEFGTRRAHGPQAGTVAARASYIGGCAGTSNVLAGKRWGIPVYGTAAHSWVMAFDDEAEAFRRFIDVFGEKSILLVDTYDPLEGARKAAALPQRFRGVRLDSGDLLAQSLAVRRILDENGHSDAIIMASGDLNEQKIAALVAGGARLDAFGVGTGLVTSVDAPYLNAVYKLVEIERGQEAFYPAKLSVGKITYPGKKQVLRFSHAGVYERDLLACAGETFPQATPLLRPVLRGGQPAAPLPALAEARATAARSLAALPPACRRLNDPADYPVERSPALEQLFEKARERYEQMLLR
jgi:nicotinate phosphoribosyltransferase